MKRRKHRAPGMCHDQSSVGTASWQQSYRRRHPSSALSFHVFGGPHPGVHSQTPRRCSRRREEADSFGSQHVITSSATTGFEHGSGFFAFFRGPFNGRIWEHLRRTCGTPSSGRSDKCHGSPMTFVTKFFGGTSLPPVLGNWQDEQEFGKS